MAAQYDPGILQQYADDLYDEAKRIVFVTALKYGIVTFVLAMIAVPTFAAFIRTFSNPSDTMPGAALIAVIGLAFGVEAGRRKALALKVQAQQVLCQRQIECNTRKQEKSATASA